MEKNIKDNYNKCSKCYNSSRREHLSPALFENLIWLTTEDTARYLSMSMNAVRIAVHRGIVRARKFNGKLYFKRTELDELIDTSMV